MDLSFLPDIVALTVFIAAFRPFVRRVGAHADLWFLGWSFLLIRSVVLLFAAAPGARHTLTSLIALWALDLCGLSFLLAAASVPAKQLNRICVLVLGTPVLFQSALFVSHVERPSLHWIASLLFLLPAAHMVVAKRERRKPLIVISVAFAGLGLLLVPVSTHHPDAVVAAALSLLFLSSAYLYAASARQYTLGVLSAIMGLTAWGLSFPIALAFARYAPLVNVQRELLELPCCLVMAGILVALLEEHVGRTENMAMHDALTGLPNLRQFEERLIATMAEARLNRTTVACLVIDVDNFKLVNDTFGHDAGDQLLRALAVRLAWHMSPRDILARTGGDEFMALLAGVNDEHHLRFIAGAMMSAASVPVVIDGHSVEVRISVGMALSPDHADDVVTLRSAADRAMYSAKRRGGSLLAFAGEEEEILTKS